MSSSLQPATGNGIPSNLALAVCTIQKDQVRNQKNSAQGTKTLDSNKAAAPTNLALAINQNKASSPLLVGNVHFQFIGIRLALSWLGKILIPANKAGLL